MGATAAFIGLSAASSVATSFSQAKATRAAADYEASVFETNVRLANIQAEDAIKRGEKEVKQIKGLTKKLIGSQRAALAAQGQNLEEDDALAIQEETAGLGAEDVFETRNNRWREAWGYRVQAEQARGRAEFTRITGKNTARNTLLTGGLQAAKTIGYGAYLRENRSRLSKSDLEDLVP